MREETGVQEFARRLNLEAQEADRVYELIKRHQTAVINVAKLSDELNSFALKYNSPFSIEELTYIQNHFISDLGESWKKRIEVLRGGPDEYMEYIEKLLEEQRMKDEIKELHQRLTEKDATIKELEQGLSIKTEVVEIKDHKLKVLARQVMDEVAKSAKVIAEQNRLRKALEEARKTFNWFIEHGELSSTAADKAYEAVGLVEDALGEGEKE